MVLGWVWGVGLLWGADSLVLTLPGALERALERSAELRATAVEVRLAELERERARALRWLPELSLRGFLTLTPSAQGDYRDPDLSWDWSRPGPFSQWVLEALQPIYLWNRTGALYEAAAAAQEAAEQGRARKADEIAFRVAQLYYTSLYLRELEALRQEAEGLLRRALRLLDSLFAQGEEGVRQADLYKARLLQEQLRLRALELERQQRVLQEGWRLQLDLPEGVRVYPADSALRREPYFLRPLADYVALALDQRPELRGLGAALAAAMATHRATQAERLPQVFFGLRGEWSMAPHVSSFRNPFVYDPLNARYVGAGVVIRQNLNFRQSALALKRTRARAEQLQAQREALQQAIRAEVTQAWAEFAAKDSACAALERALQVANEWLRTEEINFDLALGSAKDLVEAVQSQFELRMALYTTLYERQLAWLRLQQVSGRLRAELLARKE
ncbi:MAG: TolC family protein [Bacteroidota bacterium]|nr:TolC family protein [Rhodothermia bacterium]MDW8285552.1 TolC family protein [Bacteroidota bacterium]